MDRWARVAVVSAMLTCALTGLMVLVELDRLSASSPIVLTWAMLIALATAILACWRASYGSPGQRRRGLNLAAGSTVIAIAVVCLTGLGMPACFMVAYAATRAKTQNHLKQFVMAIRELAAAEKRWPAAAIRGADGMPLLSWRVAILPHIGQAELFRQFRLDEPWDSPHNRELLPRMPAVFAYPDDPYTPAGYTYFQVFVGRGTAFERDGLKLPDDFPDGPENTIAVVEAMNAVPWTKPADLEYDSNGPLPRIGPAIPWRGFRRNRHTFIAALADGSIRSIRLELSESTLRAAITRNGDDRLGDDW
jgi:hypothetical protein